MNKVFLIGRLTADPQCGTAQASGKKWARFSLAVNRMGTDAGVDFLNIVAWEKNAETAQKFLTKGKQVAIEGHIQTGSYERNGVKTNTVDIFAERIEFIGNNGVAPQKPSNDVRMDELKAVDDDDDMPF